MKNFNRIMCIVWTIISVVAGMYAVVNGGAIVGDELSDPSISYIVAAFGVPGVISIIFGFCNSVEDVIKMKNSAKDMIDGVKKC